MTPDSGTDSNFKVPEVPKKKTKPKPSMAKWLFTRKARKLKKATNVITNLPPVCRPVKPIVPRAQLIPAATGNFNHNNPCYHLVFLNMVELI